MNAQTTQPVLEVLDAAHTAQPQQRRFQQPVLRVITGGSKRKNFFFVLAILIPLAAGIAIILGINVAVSAQQYQVVQMKNEQLTLTQRNEALNQKIKNLQAPQNLAAKASKLGMVMPTSVGSIDISAQKVKGSPLPANKADKPTTWVAKPGVAASSEPVMVKTTPKLAKKKSDTPVKGAAATPEGEKMNVKELNGGTLPAPRQR